MRTRWVAVALVILAVMAVADTAWAQAPRRTLTIGMPVTPPNLPHLGVYVAKELGYFEEEGINLDLASFESGLSRCAVAWQAAWISWEPAPSR